MDYNNNRSWVGIDMLLGSILNGQLMNLLLDCVFLEGELFDLGMDVVISLLKLHYFELESLGTCVGQ
jgi:hypothetical protein